VLLTTSSFQQVFFKSDLISDSAARRPKCILDNFSVSTIEEIKSAKKFDGKAEGK
jgi:hypothetical protein